MAGTEEAWWKEAVVYQIYPKSFRDSNGDGLGDLRGIIEKLEYVKELGADVIWLNPVYESPNDDNGYDISDYRKIMKEAGTMEDFDELLSRAHSLGLKIIMDLVVNHTSDEHGWFIKSRRDKNNSCSDYYIWKKASAGKEPNNWGSRFSGSAWEYVPERDEYYLHLWSKKQPDLNWENPRVREEVYAIMRFWLDKGIDGFRMDVINCISKDPALPDGPLLSNGLYGDFRPYCQDGPRVHEYLKEMNREVLCQYDIMTVGEALDCPIEEAKRYAGFNEGELNMVFQFSHVRLDYGKYGKWSTNRFKLDDLRKILSAWQNGLNGTAWNSLYWSNHDQPRAVSRFGNDSTKEAWEKSAKMLGTCLHMMQGTPYIYQGEEIGMTNVSFQHIDDYRDIDTLNAYKELCGKLKVPYAEMMSSIHAKSRDNARTPMQWDDSKNAGFSSGRPWIGLNQNYREINVQSQENDAESILSYYKKLISLRKKHKVIVYGDFVLMHEDDPAVFAYRRNLDGRELTVFCNFTDQAGGAFPVPGDAGEILCNYPGAPVFGNTFTLRPYEAKVFLKGE